MSHDPIETKGLPEDDFFGEPISVYTDKQALEDGLLVAFPGPGRVNRITRAVFDHFTREMGPGVTDVTPLTGAIRAILELAPNDGWRTGTYQGKSLWLIPNEIGGLTLMFPEDY
jgi:hypothetical protein